MASESKSMSEIREIRKKLSEQMKGKSGKEIVNLIKKKSANVEKKYDVNLPRMEKARD